MAKSKYKTGIIRRLCDKNLIEPPSYVEGSTQYETLMGSVAYGVSSDQSDIDVYGFCIPPKSIVFPHTAGHIPNFSSQVPNFDQFQKHHVREGDKTFDIAIYSIVKYFRLCMKNNPNMIDSLFTPEECVRTCTKIGRMVRDNRKLFLHKGAWHTFKGYAHSQLHKIKVKEPAKDSKRAKLVEDHGFDTKFAYHLVRLMDEAEQILLFGDLDLTQNKEQLKSVKNGEWSLDRVEGYFYNKLNILEELYVSSKLRKAPDEEAIKELLLQCLEEYYGSLNQAVERQDKYKFIVNKIKELVSI